MPRADGRSTALLLPGDARGDEPRQPPPPRRPVALGAALCDSACFPSATRTLAQLRERGDRAGAEPASLYAVFALIGFLQGWQWAVMRPMGFLTLFWQSRGLDEAAMGRVTTMALIATTIGNPLFGAISDLSGRRRASSNDPSSALSFAG